MKRKDYEVFYIFEMLTAAKFVVGKKKLRDSVSCNGVKFKIIFDLLIAKGLLELTPKYEAAYGITDTGRSLLEEWNSILSALDLSDKLAYLR